MIRYIVSTPWFLRKLDNKKPMLMHGLFSLNVAVVGNMFLAVAVIAFAPGTVTEF